MIGFRPVGTSYLYIASANPGATVVKAFTLWHYIAIVLQSTTPPSPGHEPKVDFDFDFGCLFALAGFLSG
jgi:hypothetical protein